MAVNLTGQKKYRTKKQNKQNKMKKTASTIAMLMVANVAMAALSFNQSIVAIFGGGNPNDGWTVSNDAGLQLALRAKNRETASTANASGVYSEPTGLQAPNNNRARWNWEWSISSGTVPLNTFDYYVKIDLDPSTGTNFLIVNALTFWSDNSYGTSATLNGQGLEGPASTYAGTSTVAQQSQNIMFYPGQDATLNATYSYELYAVASGDGENGAKLSRVAITVVVGAGGPLPPDGDNDGVPDSQDHCLTTNPGEAVDEHGCSVQDLINEIAAQNPADHGEYVSGVVELANRLFKEGRITQLERKFIIKTAAQSDIGKQ